MMWNNQEPEIAVGLLRAPEIQVTLHGSYRLNEEMLSGRVTFRLNKEHKGAGGLLSYRAGQKTGRTTLPLTLVPVNYDQEVVEVHQITIGIDFHWQRQEDQLFRGSLRLVEEGGQLRAINVLKLEDYLVSVISSEMKATASTEFLKAHAIMSRSWLLAQLQKAAEGGNAAGAADQDNNPERHIRWYDREDHALFDVCADDHCQRYQGLTRATEPRVEAAVRETSGQVLLYNDRVCDARFSKCCGGTTESFEEVWEPIPHPYLGSWRDGGQGDLPNLREEEQAAAWILGQPEAWCRTSDREVLAQVLNDYDQETQDFFRWEVVLSQQELQRLLKEKIGLELGAIQSLHPLKRDGSGRISELEITGTQGRCVVGKELEIRKALSPSHLYSSAFVVEAQPAGAVPPESFRLRGAGWGHGVGLCQIGAAVMGAAGKDHTRILLHYFRGAALKKLY